MKKLAIIGGTGALRLFPELRKVPVSTPFGAPSDRPRELEVAGKAVLFLPRHGDPHRIPPHRVNYRANIHALKALGVDSILALNAVGGLKHGIEAGVLLVPDQLIDLTWGRAHTFSDGGSAPLRHIDFTHPYAGALRAELLIAASVAGQPVIDGGCHVVTQGPRLETAAEVRRLAAMGGDVVGMTAMPEAALAREAGLDYSGLCMVANAGAGLAQGEITEQDIHDALADASDKVRSVITALIGKLDFPGE